MRATLRITWLILSLGFLCHNVCSDSSAGTTTPVTSTHTGTISATANTTVIRTSAATTTTLAVATNQNSISIHVMRTVTSPTMMSEHASKDTQTEPGTFAQDVTKSTTENKTGNDPSTKVISSTSTAVVINSPKNTAMTIMPHSSNSSTVAATVSSKEAVVSSELSQAHVTTAVTDTAEKKFKTPISTVAPTMSQKGSSKSSDPLNTVTTAATAFMGVTSLSEGTQASSTRTPDFPRQETSTITSTTTAATTTTTTIATTPTTTTTTIATTPTTTTTTIATTPTTTTTTIATTPTTLPPLQVFSYSHNTKEESTDKNLEEVCKKLMVNFAAGNCTLKYYKQQNGTIKINSVETNGKVNASVAQQYYEEITTKPKDNKTLIAILASCIALLIMIVILAACASHHRKPYNENQQHLTEELQTVENCYHDNPTLEVMEVQYKMQEKKVVLNGEFNDSWIVPFDNLLKEDIPDEEDTHL